MGGPDVDAAARAITERAGDVAALREARTVAAYVALGTEPGTAELLERLYAGGTRVLLPVLLGDDDLDWGAYAGADALVAGRRGLREPGGPRLGVGAVAGAEVVLVPGLAVSSEGYRLGRGGGSYDRALARVPASALTMVVLYPDEVGVAVPREEHDRPVDAALTPGGIVPLGR